MIVRKKLIYCTYPSLYSCIVLKALLALPNIEVIAVISSTRRLKVRENRLFSDVQRIRESGIPYAIYLWFITTGYKATRLFSVLESVKHIARTHNIPVYKTNNINSPGMANKIQDLLPEILLCAHFNQRISQLVYSLASEAALNIHPSILPDLKGVDPGFYALQEGYHQTGVTLHNLAKEFDEGLTISQKQYDICDSDTLLSLNQSLFNLGSHLVSDYLQNSAHTTLKLTKSKRPSRYDSWPSKGQVKEMRKKRHLVSYNDLKQFSN